LTEVISVKFNCHGKAYFFAPNGVQAKAGDKVVVETAKGLDMGSCSAGNHYVEDSSVVQPLRPVVRVATEEDLQTAEQNKLREKEAFEICREKIIQHDLDMKLVDVECSFEGNKILFFFTSDGRVDFRELVKDLASVFRTRIELRQIGVRDETKMLGGLGICGRPYCCSQFLNDFEPVSTKMAKCQSMSLNPTKISGSCGRLMCCLRYEQDAYEELIKTIPKNGAFVQTTAGYGNVVQTNILRQTVRVRLDGDGDAEVRTFDADQVAAIPGGRPKQGDALPEVLVYVEKPKLAETLEDDPWKAPDLFASDEQERRVVAAAPDKAVTAEAEPVKKKPHNRGRNRNNNNQKKSAAGVQPQAVSNSGSQLQNKLQQPKTQNPEKKNGDSQLKSGVGNMRSRRRRPNNRPKPQQPQE
jgi:cell fate regulator YaaT (PSP1 superfamily)